MNQSPPSRLPVCVVIPVLDGLGLLPEVLTSVLRQAVAGDKVLIADAGSTDGSVPFALKVAGQTHGVTLVTGHPSLGLAGALAAALGVAPLGPVLVLDAHLALPEGFLDLAAGVLASAGPGAVAVPVLGGSPCVYGDRDLLAAAGPARLLGPDLEPLRAHVHRSGGNLLVAPPADVAAPLEPRQVATAPLPPRSSPAQAAPPPSFLTPAGAAVNRPGQDRPLRVAILTFDDPAHACYQLRVGRPLELLGGAVEAQLAVGRDSPQVRILQEPLASADLVVVQRFFPNPNTMPLVRQLLAQGCPVLYETDDLLHDVPDTNPHKRELTALAPHIVETMRLATALTVSTPALRDELIGFNGQIHVLPNLLDERIWGASLPPWTRRPGPVVIGYAGTVTHLADLAIVEEALVEIARKWGDQVAFRFLGCVTDRLMALPNAAFVRFQPGYQAYAGSLPSAGIDVGVVPLEDNRFNRGKSHIKWLEYSAAAIAGVYSDLPPYAVVRNGETGLRVPNTTRDWFEAVDRLVGDGEARRRIAWQARQEALSAHGMKAGAQRILEVYREVVAARPRPRA